MKTLPENGHFISGFRSSLNPEMKIGLRPDLWPYIISWPLVYIIARARMTPNQVGLLSLISGMGVIGCLFGGLYLQNPLMVASLLLIRILLDCADGQLARYTGQTSSLGALYDLTSDFLFVLLLTAATAYALVIYHGESPDVIVPLAISGFFGSTMAATIHSFVSALASNPGESRAEVQQRFLHPPLNDRPGNPSYTARLSIFSFLFLWSWGGISRLVMILIGRGALDKWRQKLLSLLSPVEFGAQMILLLIIVTFRGSLFYVYLFQLLGLAGSLLMIFIFDD